MKKYLKDYPNLVEEWNYKKNEELGLFLDKITSKNGNKAWWICKKCEGEWFATIASRTDNHGCPYCSGRLVKKGINDLETLCPEIASEWHPTKNGTLKPYEVSIKSSKKVWWLGKCGHEWCALISNRTNGSGCPKCKLSAVSSFPEQAIYYYMKKIYSDTLTRDTHLGVELDIYIPSIKVAIEYDGEAWHKGKKKEHDIKKNNICNQNNIKLIRIREKKLDTIEGCISIVREDSNSDKSLEKCIKNLFKILNLPIDNINILRDTPLILEQYSVIQLNNSLAKCFPDIADEWHPTKNGNLTPDQISKGSRRIVWWLGKCGHEYEMVVSERTNIRKNGKAYGCPVCAGKRVLKGINDLKTLYPSIASEWDYEKNVGIPSDFLANSNQNIWWRCSKGHSWNAKIQSRTHAKSNCPYCSNKKVLKGYNDLKTVCPELVKDWDYQKNDKLNIKPDAITFGSNKRVCWKCHLCGHEWDTYVCSRTKKKTKCPKCGRKK